MTIAPRWLHTLLVAPIFLAGCGNTGEAERARIELTGSSTVAPVAAELAEAFEAKHPEARVTVQAGGSARGIMDARRGLVDLGMASRGLTAAERKELTAFTIARDGIAVIVHEDNAVDALAHDAVRRIFAGRVERWSAVGGADAPITVVNKAEGRGTHEVFLRHFALESPAIEADVVIGDNQQAIKTVAGNPGAVGYVSVGAAAAAAERGVAIRPLSAHGVAPTVERVAAGAFPISRPLNLVAQGPPEGPAARFLDFARSERAHAIIRSHRYAPAGE